MDGLPAAPYRSSPRAIRLLRPEIRRPLRTRTLWGLVAVAVVAASAIIGGDVLAVSAAVGLMGTPVVTAVRRSRALRRLERLPFVVRHSRESAVSGWSQNYSAIRDVAIELAQPLDPVAAERVVGDAHARAPGVLIAIHGDGLVLSGWPWGADDLLLLSELLSTWGAELHASHAIRDVFVTWAPGGPPAIV